MPRRKQTETEATPATMSDGELADFIETTRRDSERPGREGWRAFYLWCEADDERRRRREKHESGPRLVAGKDN